VSSNFSVDSQRLTEVIFRFEDADLRTR